MNKQEIAVVVLLFAALIGWMFLQKQVGKPEPAADTPPPVVATNVTISTTTTVPPKQATVQVTPATVPPAVVSPAEAAVERAKEQRVVLSNDVVSVTMTSHGAGVVSATLHKFRSAVEKDSPFETLDFGRLPALTLDGVPGLGRDGDFEMKESADGRSVTFRATATNGLCLERVVTLTNGYSVSVRDTFTASGAATILPKASVRVGAMRMGEKESTSQQTQYLGVDTMAESSKEGMKHWASEVPKIFGFSPPFWSCGRMDATHLPDRILKPAEAPLQWIAVKNKFFVQVLMLIEEPSAGWSLGAARDMKAAETFALSSVWASVDMTPKEIKAGESFVRRAQYYIGPKEYREMRMLGSHQADVMEFGFWSWLCKPLLLTLNAIHKVLPNYGVAIILITILVRLIFWPVTRKSTESMKRMQEIQPLMNELKEKYKDKPQKLNQEMMELWKKHKVNPMAGCLPILVQIPVFIALFNVLQSAVELRFAPFLWINDLSEPEGLLAGLLPFGLALNLLPLIMTGMTVVQQKMTPSTGDSTQQNMMMIMPVVMLFLFYNFASALMLYWTVSQLLALLPILMQKYNIRMPWSKPAAA